MKSWRKTFLVAAVAALLGGGAWPGRRAARPPRNRRTRPRRHGRRAGGGNRHRAGVEVHADRALSDRRHQAQGRVARFGVTRAFYVDGAGSTFADQGGHADGCGIPSAASAIQATVTAVSATGNGSLKLIRPALRRRPRRS